MISPDYFLEYRPRQPKKEIGDYAETQDIPVPGRFTDVKAALTSGKDLIVRSEHPQDYNGISDLLESSTISPNEITDAYESVKGKDLDWESMDDYIRAKTWLIAHVDTLPQVSFERRLSSLCKGKIKIYCNLMGIDIGAFVNDITYSYWEKITRYE